MRLLPQLIDNNRNWARSITAGDPEFFAELAKKQSPEFLWIGCADSRVPANQIVGLAPGEVFVHRNIANVVVRSDFNCLSVIEYAVAVLKVKHIIVCRTTVVQEAWEKGRSLGVYGWIYRIQDGLIHDLDVTITGQDEVAGAYRVATNAATSSEHHPA